MVHDDTTHEKRITAIYPGSFDPMTNGHLDLVERSVRLVDRLVIAILKNEQKQALFSVDERIEMAREVTAEIPNIEVAAFDGLLVDFAAQCRASVIVRGIRAVSDYE